MNNNEARVVGTLLIWTALTIIAVASMVTHLDINGSYLFFGMLVMIIAGSITTGAIWRSGSHEEDSIRRSEKTKRRSRVDRMLESMDNDDLEELRARLMSETDGETVSLEELLTGQSRRGRR